MLLGQGAKTRAAISQRAQGSRHSTSYMFDNYVEPHRTYTKSSGDALLAHAFRGTTK